LSSATTQSAASDLLKTMFSRLILLGPAFIVFVITLIFGLIIGLAAARNPTILWGLSIGSVFLVGFLTSILGLGITSFLVADLYENKPLSIVEGWNRAKPLLGPLALIGIILFVTGLTALIPVPVVGSIIQGIIWTFITPSAVLICLRGDTPVQALINGFNMMVNLVNRDALTFVLILVFYMFSWVTFGVLYILAIPLTVLAIAYMLGATAEVQAETQQA